MGNKSTKAGFLSVHNLEESSDSRSQRQLVMLSLQSGRKERKTWSPGPFLLFCYVWTLTQGMVLPGCRLSLTALINPIGKLPHRHAQRVFVCVMLDPAVLAIAYYN